LEQIGVRPRTLTSYRKNLTRHILPVYGAWKVREIHRGHVKQLLAAKRLAGLGKNSVRLIRATFSVMLGDAVEDGVLVINPALQIERRGRRRHAHTVTAVERQERLRAMTVLQLETF